MSDSESSSLRGAVLDALGLDEGAESIGRLAARVHARQVAGLDQLDRDTLLAVLKRAADRPFTWEQRDRRPGLGRPPEALRAWLAEHAPAEERLLRRWAGLPWAFSELMSPLERVQALGGDAIPPDGDDVELIPAGPMRDAATVLWAERGVLDATAQDRVDGIGKPIARMMARGMLLGRGVRVPAARLVDWAEGAGRLTSPRPLVAVYRLAILAAARSPEADTAFERLLRTALTAGPDDQTRVVDALASATVGLGLSVPFERLAKSLLLRPPQPGAQLGRVVGLARALARSSGGLAEAGYAALRQILPHVRTRVGHAVIHAAGLMALSRTAGRSLDVVEAEVLSTLAAAAREPSDSAEALGARIAALELVAEASPAVALAALEASADRGHVARVMAPWV